MSENNKPVKCEFCKHEACDCLRAVCPIHGNTKFIATNETRQVKTGTDKQDAKIFEPVYKCCVEGCDIKRIKKEM